MVILAFFWNADVMPVVYYALLVIGIIGFTCWIIVATEPYRKPSNKSRIPTAGLRTYGIENRHLPFTTNGDVVYSGNTPGARVVQTLVVSSRRKDGNTTRAADKAIQLLFTGSKVIVEDTSQGTLTWHTNEELLNLIVRRLEREHPRAFEKLKIDRSRLIIWLDSKPEWVN